MNSPSIIPTPGARAIAILAMLLSLPALIVPFVSFVDGYSPLDTVVWVFKGDELWLFVLLGAPFFLGIPIAAAQIARVASQNISRVWRTAGFALAAFSAALTLTWTGMGALEILKNAQPVDLSEYLVVLLVPSILAIGAIWLWRSPRTTDATARVTVSLAAAYLANAPLCLVTFRGDPALGWWLALVACAGIAIDAAQIAMAARRKALG